MKKRVLIIALAVIGISGLVATPFAVAQAGAGLRERLGNTPLGRFITGRVGRAMVLRAEMDVTPEQRQAIRGIVKSHRAEIIQAAGPIVEKRRALRNEILAKEPNEEAIRAAAADLAGVIGDAAVLGSTISGEIRGVLTDEQIAKIADFIGDNTLATDEFLSKIAAE